MCVCGDRLFLPRNGGRVFARSTPLWKSEALVNEGQWGALPEETVMLLQVLFAAPHGSVPGETQEWESIFLELLSCPYFGD